MLRTILLFHIDILIFVYMSSYITVVVVGLFILPLFYNTIPFHSSDCHSLQNFYTNYRLMNFPLVFLFPRLGQSFSKYEII